MRPTTKASVLMVAIVLAMIFGPEAEAQESGRAFAPPRQAPRVPEGVETKLDLEFAKVGERSLRLDLYLPKAEVQRPVPVVVWIFGGAWLTGSRKFGPAVPLATEGFAVATIDYRLSQEAKFPAQIEDCKAAIRWLRANAERFGLDRERFGVWGLSAGGHLSALVGTSGKVKEFDVGENLEFSSAVRAACDWFGPTDFNQLAPHAPPGSRTPYGTAESPEGRLVGGALADKQELVAKANPITFVDGETPPFLIVHGDVDNLIPVNQSQILADALNSKGRDVTYVVLPGSGHGTGAFNTPEEFERVRAFFARHLQASAK